MFLQRKLLLTLVATAALLLSNAAVALSVVERKIGAAREAEVDRQAQQNFALFQKIQVLQEEIQQMRGQLEEQQHALDGMRSSQNDRYVDLDTRINDLDAKVIKVSERSVEVGKVEGESVSSSASEKKLYQQAKTYVLERQFDKAIVAFNSLLTDYSGGSYVPYAHYWLGEVYMVLDEQDLKKAEIHFDAVIKSYPKHSKVPASLYKQATIQNLRGKKSKAKVMLNRIMIQYPGSSEAKLAESYLTQVKAK